jgi:phage N-6-adenine-methyltransferase
VEEVAKSFNLMGIGKINNFKSEKIVYSTPIKLFEVINKEFNFNLDVCANEENAKCQSYFSEKQDGLKQDWTDSVWMNPPFNKELKKWVIKARDESIKHGSVVCCLVPFRGNTVWFKEVCMDAEIRFIIGEVNFNDLDRGLWLPMCLMIFGTDKKGTFSYIDYKQIRKND